jgi:arsenate reductase
MKSPDVLFVCVHNAGRSQMAKAFFNIEAKQAGLRLVADSAGTFPAMRVHPEVLAVMHEIGIGLSAATGKLLTDDLLTGEPRIITMGCSVDSEACPALRLDAVVDWGLPDPKGKSLAQVREIRDEIHQRVKLLIAEMAVSADVGRPGLVTRST